MKHRTTFQKLDKPEQVKVSKPMMEALARDLMDAHRARKISLDRWPAAREVVTDFYKEEKNV